VLVLGDEFISVFHLLCNWRCMAVKMKQETCERTTTSTLNTKLFKENYLKSEGRL
jgi:hypothetical protein